MGQVNTLRSARNRQHASWWSLRNCLPQIHLCVGHTSDNCHESPTVVHIHAFPSFPCRSAARPEHKAFYSGDLQQSPLPHHSFYQYRRYTRGVTTQDTSPSRLYPQYMVKLICFAIYSRKSFLVCHLSGVLQLNERNFLHWIAETFVFSSFCYIMPFSMIAWINGRHVCLRNSASTSCLLTPRAQDSSFVFQYVYNCCENRNKYPWKSDTKIPVDPYCFSAFLIKKSCQFI